MLNYLKWAQLVNLRLSETIRTSIKHGSINHWTENIRNQKFYETNNLHAADSRYRLDWLTCIINVFQFPKVEECDFDRQFLFDEYVAISHR